MKVFLKMTNSLKNLVSIFICLLFLSACASREPLDPSLTIMSESEFQETMEASSQRSQIYSGLYNIIDMSGTLLSTAVLRAQMDQSARLYRWDKAKWTTEMNKVTDVAKNETQVFLSFYTPDKKNDDLHKNGTQWRVYLEADGRRWEGKVMKVKLALAEIKGIYAYHTSFATPYLITFPVSTTNIEVKKPRLVVTGPIGMSALEF